MARLPSELTGDYPAEIRNPDPSLDGLFGSFAEVTITIPELDAALALITEWGEILPYSSYPGFFRLILLTREQGTSFRSITPLMDSLAHAATYVRDFRADTVIDNPEYLGVIGLQIVFEAPPIPISIKGGKNWGKLKGEPKKPIPPPPVSPLRPTTRPIPPPPVSPLRPTTRPIPPPPEKKTGWGKLKGKKK